MQTDAEDNASIKVIFVLFNNLLVLLHKTN